MIECANVGTILETRLFDRAFYLQQNPDVACRSKIYPLMHYLTRGGSEGRDPHPLFDSSFYLERNPQVADRQLNPLIHFLTEGARQGLDPHPLFSVAYYLEQGLSLEECLFNPLVHYLEIGAQSGFDPHPLFSGAYYLGQLDDVESKAADFNPLTHYLSIGALRGLAPCQYFDGRRYYQRYPDVAAAGVNPLLHFLSNGQAEGRIGLIPGSKYTGPAYQSVLEKVKESIEEPFSHLIVSSELIRGGSVRCACSFASAMIEKVGLRNVLFLVTDYGEMSCVDWLPEGTRIINLPQLEPALFFDDKANLFLELLTLAQPRIAMNFNSNIYWKSLDGVLASRKKELSTKFVAYLGGYEDYVDLNCHGFSEGEIQRLVEHLDLFVTDNDRLRNAMVDLYRNVPGIEDKVVACYKSLTDELLSALCVKRGIDHLDNVGNCSSAAPQRIDGQNDLPTRKILWASRLDGMKQPALLGRIAEQMPDVQFDVYGRRCLGMDSLGSLSELANVALLGEYEDFSAISIRGTAAFLHTSNSDSMPHVLVEAAAAGLPIIAPDIGAIGELIDESTGWLVADCNDVSEYVKIVKYVLEHPDEARARAYVLHKLVRERHNWSAFLERVYRLDIWPE